VALRSGLRSIEASPRPGQAANGLIREYQGRKAQAVETSTFADPSDAQELRVKLYRQRGGIGWFPSDPQFQALARFDRDVITGLTLSEFQDRGRQIAVMARPYPKDLVEDEKDGMGSFNERNPVLSGECPDHMKPRTP